MIIIGQIGEKEKYERFFEAEFKDEFITNWNIQEGDSCYCLSVDTPHKFSILEYGLIPFWSSAQNEFYEAPIDGRERTDAVNSIKIRIIQDSKFRKPIRETRCIIPADYIILSEGGRSFLFFNQDKSPLAIAGVYDSWKRNIKDKELHKGFAILTLPSYGMFEDLELNHIPFMLPRRKCRRWIHNNLHLIDVTSMIENYSDELLNGYEVDIEKVKSKENTRLVTKPVGEFLKQYSNRKGNLLLKLRGDRYKRGALYDNTLE